MKRNPKRFYKRTFDEGLHRIDVVIFDCKVWAIRQYQRVQSRWTQAGCFWYSENQLDEFGRRALKGEGELIDSGKATEVKIPEAGILLEAEHPVFGAYNV